LASGSALLGTLGTTSAGVGTVTVDGIGSVWNITGDIHVGHNSATNSGTGTDGAMLVTGGGLVTTTGNAFMGEFAFNTDSGTVDDQGSAWNISGSLTVGGAIPQDGTAVLIVKNGSSVSAGGFLIGPHGTVKGNGMITGNVLNGGLVSPGSSLGPLHITGNYTQ